MQIVGYILKGTVSVKDIYGKEQTLTKGQSIMMGDTVQAKGSKALILFEGTTEPVVLSGTDTIEADEGFLDYIATLAKSKEEGTEVLPKDESAEDEPGEVVEVEDESQKEQTEFKTDNSSINRIDFFDTALGHVEFSQYHLAEETSLENKIQFVLMGEGGAYYIRGSEAEKLMVYDLARNGELSDPYHFEVMGVTIDTEHIPIEAVNAVLQNNSEDLSLADTANVAAVVQQVVDALNSVQDPQIEIDNATIGILLGSSTHGNLTAGELDYLNTQLNANPRNDPDKVAEFYDKFEATVNKIYDQALSPEEAKLSDESDTGTTAYVTQDTTPTIIVTLPGDVSEGDTVKLYDGETLIGKSHALDAEDIARGSVDVSANLATLGDGTHALSVTMTDGHGNESEHTPLIGGEVTIDTSADGEAVSGGDGIALSISLNNHADNDVGVMDDNQTNDATPTLDLGGIDSDIVEIVISGLIDQNGHAIDVVLTREDADHPWDTAHTGFEINNGVWSYTPTVELQNGTHTISIAVIDDAGNTASVALTSTGGRDQLLIDTTADNAGTESLGLHQVAGYEVINDSEKSHVEFDLRGVDVSSETQSVEIVITDHTGNHTITLVAERSGDSWKFEDDKATLTVEGETWHITGLNLSAFDDGKVEIKATVVDDAGNVLGETGTIVIAPEKDTHVDGDYDSDINDNEALSIALSDASDGAVGVVNDSQTNDNTPTIDLTGLDGDIMAVTVTVDGVAYTIQREGLTGEWTGDMTYFGDFDTSKGGAGNTGVPTTFTPTLLEGSHTVTMSVMDDAGNTSETFSTTLRVDTRVDGDQNSTINDGEALSISLNSHADNDVGVVNDSQTNDNTPTIDLTGLDGDIMEVTVTVDGVAHTIQREGLTGEWTGDMTYFGDFDTSKGGAGNTGVPTTFTPTLLEGSHTVTMSVMDDAGNTSETFSTTLRVDTRVDGDQNSTINDGEALSISLNSHADNDVGVVNDSQTNDNTPTIDLTGLDGDIMEVTVTVDGVAHTIQREGLTGEWTGDTAYFGDFDTSKGGANNTGVPTTFTPLALTDGSHTVTMTATDDAGNQSAEIKTEINIDTDPDEGDDLGIALSGASDDHDFATEQDASTDDPNIHADNQTNDNTPTLDLTGIDPDVVTVTVSFALVDKEGQAIMDANDNPIIHTVDASKSGTTWSLPETTLSDGHYAVSIAVTDDAGNTTSSDLSSQGGHEHLVIDTAVDPVSVVHGDHETHYDLELTAARATEEGASGLHEIQIKDDQGAPIATLISSDGETWALKSGIDYGDYAIELSNHATEWTTANLEEGIVINTKDNLGEDVLYTSTISITTIDAAGNSTQMDTTVKPDVASMYESNDGETTLYLYHGLSLNDGEGQHLTSFQVAGGMPINIDQAAHHSTYGTTVIEGVGTITIYKYGTYEFTPIADYYGKVPEITYTTNTGASTTFNITVTNVNDKPEIIIEDTDTTSASLDEGNATLSTSGTLHIEDIDNRFGTSDTVKATVTGIEIRGNHTSIDDTTLKDMLTVPETILSPNQEKSEFTWSFNSGTHTFDYLAKGEELELTYIITVDDGHGGTVTQEVTITITGTNDAPTITADATDDAATVAETVDVVGGTDADPVDATGTITFADVDVADTHTANISTTVKDGNDVAIVAPVGTLTLDTLDNAADSVGWRFHVDNSAIDYLAEGESLTQVYTVTVDDGKNHGTVTQEVTITITGTNDAPTITADATDDAVTVAETVDVVGGTDADPVDATGTITFADVDVADTHTANISTTVKDGNDVAIVAPVGTLTLDTLDNAADSVGWRFHVDNSAIDYLAEGESLTQVYTVTVDDGKNHGTVTQEVTITITGTNDAPSIDLDVDDNHTTAEGVFTTAYSQGHAPVHIADEDMHIYDIDQGDQIGSATITITNWKTGDTLKLGSLEGTGVTSESQTSENDGTLTLTLTGVADATTYESIIKSITYENTYANKDTDISDRTITTVITDKNGLSSEVVSSQIQYGLAVNIIEDRDNDGKLEGVYSNANYSGELSEDRDIDILIDIPKDATTEDTLSVTFKGGLEELEGNATDGYSIDIATDVSDPESDNLEYIEYTNSGNDPQLHINSADGTWSLTLEIPVSQDMLEHRQEYIIIKTPPAENETLTVSVDLLDTDGVTLASSSDSIIRTDETAPVVTITSDIATTDTGVVTYTFAFDEAVTGFGEEDIKVDKGGDKVANSFTDNGDGTYSIQVKPTDDNSNYDGDLTVSVQENAVEDTEGNKNLATKLEYNIFIDDDYDSSNSNPTNSSDYDYILLNNGSDSLTVKQYDHANIDFGAGEDTLYIDTEDTINLANIHHVEQIIVTEDDAKVIGTAGEDTVILNVGNDHDDDLELADYSGIEHIEVQSLDTMIGTAGEDTVVLKSSDFKGINLAGGTDTVRIDTSDTIDLSKLHNIENIILDDGKLTGSGNSDEIKAADLFEDNNQVIISDSDHADDGDTEIDIALESGKFTRSDTMTEIEGHNYYTYTEIANTDHTIKIENHIDVSWN